MKEPRYFVSVGDHPPIGPVTLEQLRQAIAAGKVPESALVSEEGGSRWRNVVDVLSRQSSRGQAVAYPPSPPQTAVTSSTLHLPNRVWPVSAASIVVFVVLGIVHWVLFNTVYAAGPWGVALWIAIVGAAIMQNTASLKSLTPKELFDVLTRTRWRLYVIAGLLVGFELWALTNGTRYVLSHRAGTELLARPDVCSVLPKYSAPEVYYDSQVGEQIAERTKSCREQADRTAQLDRLRADAAVRKAACERVIGALAKGAAPVPEDVAKSEVNAGFLERVRSATLKSDDLQRVRPTSEQIADANFIPNDNDNTVPIEGLGRRNNTVSESVLLACDGGLWPSYVAAARSSVSAWEQIQVNVLPSNDLVESLRQPGAGLTDAAKKAYAARIDVLVRDDLPKASSASDLNPLIVQCKTASQLGITSNTCGNVTNRRKVFDWR